jgi:histone-lysine N-methyltransferase SETMAR
LDLYFIYDPETKKQSKEWSHSGSRVQRSSGHKSSSKVLTSVFWDTDEILLVDHLGKGVTTTAKSYSALLGKLKQRLVSKRRGKLLKGILSLQDNGVPHKVAITHQKLADLHIEISNHPAYSLDLAPSDGPLS